MQLYLIILIWAFQDQTVVEYWDDSYVGDSRVRWRRAVERFYRNLTRRFQSCGKSWRF